MKRIAYTILLVFSLFLCNDVFAQVDLTDPNWDFFFDDEFDYNGRVWDGDTYIEQVPLNHSFIPKWRCCMLKNWPSQVVTGPIHHRHVYQRSNVLFSRSTVSLKAEFRGTETLLCDDFESPNGSYCNDADLRPIYYFSGMLETIERLGFGYYEVRCKVPVHLGSCASFWFWASEDNYEEIDVMEYYQGTYDTAPNRRKYINGIWYNPTETNNPNYIGNSIVEWDSLQPDISNYHTYACEWMPDHVTWYFDGEIINHYDNQDSIPQHRMYLRLTHPIDKHAADSVNGVPAFSWTGNDIMSVDYVRGYRLKTDCNTDVTIQNTSQFNAYDPSVKHSITIGDSNNTVLDTLSTNVVMRATENIVVNQFEVPLGRSVTLKTQECPNW